ncbi:MAG: CAP domain-containing protein [Lachnospiraceae bacterium]|nr:CAP domain-containing protein [Lachnospiraceae bacterium]
MRKVSVCLATAALLFAVGGAKEAQAAVIPVNVINLNCDTVEQWKDKLEGLNVNCDWLEDLLSKIECGDVPEVEVPEVEVPEQPEVPDVNVPTLPETPEEEPETSPEVQDQAYVYGLRITELVNEHRAAAGLSPVEYSAELSDAAQTRAFEIEKSFSHTRPDGRYFSTVLKDHGISYRYSGENIAWGQKSPEQVVTAWMNSAGHRANILNKSFTKLGVGYQQNERGVNYFTQLFTN